MARMLHNPMSAQTDVLTRDLAQESIDRDCALYELRQARSKRERYAAIKAYEGAHELHRTHRCNESQAILLAADGRLLSTSGQVR